MKNTTIKYVCVISCLCCLFCSCTAKETGSNGNTPKEFTQKETEQQETDHTKAVVEEVSETATEDATEEMVKEPVIQTLTLTAAGDCTLGKTQDHSYEGSFYDYYDSKGESYFFQGVSDVFQTDDFTLVNLECVLTESETRVDKTFNLKGKPEYVGVLTSGSVEGCSLGNNHTRDYGEVSLTDTQGVLDQAGIVYGYNDHVGIYKTQDGLKVAVVSASVLSQSAEYEDYIKNGIENVKGFVDLIVVCCHWGIEREYYPNGYQKTLAHKIIDWGADLLIGTHPHVLQGIEYYKGKIICYSLGNFCFGGNKNPSDKNTMMYQQTFTYQDGTLMPEVSARIIPCTVSSASGYNDYQPTIVSSDKKDEIISKVNKYSEQFENLSIDENGTIILEEADREES